MTTEPCAGTFQEAESHPALTLRVAVEVHRELLPGAERLGAELAADRRRRAVFLSSVLGQLCS